jgi:hypothetical protein
MNAEEKQRAEDVALLRKAAALAAGSFVGAELTDAANGLGANEPVKHLVALLTEAREIVKEFE